MIVPARLIKSHIPKGQTTFSLCFENGDPIKAIDTGELLTLAEQGYVYARVRGRIRAVILLVPVAVAFRALGETKKRIKNVFHSDASDTTIRRSNLRNTTSHHAYHCLKWPRFPLQSPSGTEPTTPTSTQYFVRGERA
jgi:hypothetical protein